MDWRKNAERALYAAQDHLELFPDRERLVLAGRANGRTRESIGRKLDITIEKVRQTEQHAARRAQTLSKDSPQGFYYYERFGP